MRRRTMLVGAGVLVAALAGAGGGIAAAGGEGADRPITGPALSAATAAALAYTGGGRVTGTEVGDEDGYYEVEVTLADGRQVDVHLDPQFAVLGSTTDRDGAGDPDDAGGEAGRR